MALGTGSGGKPWEDRELAGSVRQLALKEIKKTLEGNDSEFKRALILKLAGTVLPRLSEFSGPEGAPIPLLNIMSKEVALGNLSTGPTDEDGVHRNNGDEEDSEAQEKD